MEDLNKDNTEINFSLNQKIVEALIFSSAEPISYLDLQKRIIDKKLLQTNLSKKYPFKK